MNVFLNVFLNCIIIISESLSFYSLWYNINRNTKTTHGGPLYVVLLMHASPHNLFLNSASNVTLLWMFPDISEIAFV